MAGMAKGMIGTAMGALGQAKSAAWGGNYSFFKDMGWKNLLWGGAAVGGLGLAGGAVGAVSPYNTTGGGATGAVGGAIGGAIGGGLIGGAAAFGYSGMRGINAAVKSGSAIDWGRIGASGLNRAAKFSMRGALIGAGLMAAKHAVFANRAVNPIPGLY